MSTALRKQQRLEQVKRLLLAHPDGISITEIRETLKALKLSQSTAFRYVVDDLEAREVKYGFYTLDPSPEDVQLAEIVISRQRHTGA